MDDNKRIGLDRNTPEGAGVEFAGALANRSPRPSTRRWMAAAVTVAVVFVLGVIAVATIFG